MSSQSSASYSLKTGSCSGWLLTFKHSANMKNNTGLWKHLLFTFLSRLILQSKITSYLTNNTTQYYIFQCKCFSGCWGGYSSSTTLTRENKKWLTMHHGNYLRRQWNTILNIQTQKTIMYNNDWSSIRLYRANLLWWYDLLRQILYTCHQSPPRWQRPGDRPALYVDWCL